MQQNPPPREADWKAFWSLLCIQSINSLNEKGVQFILIALGIWLGQMLQYPLSVLIVVPFVLFSPVAGWISDRYCKTQLLRRMLLLQVIALVGIAVGLFTHSMVTSVFFFSVFCVQAMFFSPAKKGLVKDMVGTENIGFASGMLEISSLLALLVGQIGALWVVYDLLRRWGENAGWEAAAWPCGVCLVTALGVYALSFLLPCYPAQGKRMWEKRILYEHLTQLKMLWNDRILRYSEVGIGFFWFIAGVMMLIALQMAEEAQGGAVAASGRNFMQVLGQQKDSALLIAWISGGSVLGGACASLLCRKRINVRLIIPGGAGIFLSCFSLLLLPYGHPLFYAALAGAGFFASGYLVPLNALLQDHAQDDRRGDVVAAGNLVDCGLGILAVVVQLLMRMVGLDARSQCAVLGISAAFMTLYLIREMKLNPPKTLTIDH